MVESVGKLGWGMWILINFSYLKLLLFMKLSVLKGMKLGIVIFYSLGYFFFWNLINIARIYQTT